MLIRTRSTAGRAAPARSKPCRRAPITAWHARGLLLLAACTLLAVGCGASAQLGHDVAVPDSGFVQLSAEVQTEVGDALRVANDDGADPIDRAEAYLYISDVNLFIWDEIQRKADDLDESQGDTFRAMDEAGRQHFLQAHRARARSWAERAKDSPKYIAATNYERRFAGAWEHHTDVQVAYDELSSLLGEVIEAREARYIEVDFLTDLRYSAAIFYTLLGMSPADMNAILTVCRHNEAEAVRFAGDIAYLYDRLVAQPEIAAETYRAIAQAKPKTREGYEAQVSVLEALRKTQRLGAMETGSSEAFDVSSEGIELFRSVNRDIDVLVELSEYKKRWVNKEADDDNLEARAEELVRTFTLRMHGLAQQQDNATFYELASSAYDNYQALFPNSGFAYEMLFFHAEALFKMRRFDDAYEKYKLALGTSPNGRFRDDIVRNLVMTAYERCRTERLPGSPSETRIEMPEAQRDLISAGEQFISILGESDPTMTGYVRYEIVLRHYLYGEIRVAEPQMETFVKFDSDHPEAPRVAILWLDLLAREAIRGKDREKRELERAVERVQSTSVLIGNDPVRQKVEEVTRNPPYASGKLP